MSDWTETRLTYNKGGFIWDPRSPMYIGNPLGDRNASPQYGAGWRDLVGQLRESRAAGAGVPVWTQIGSTGFYFYKFAVNDSIQVIYHVDHDFYYGSSVFFHTHWFKDGTNVQPVKWQMSVVYAHGHQQGVFNFTTPTTDTIQQVPEVTAYTHQIAELATGIDKSYRTDGIIVMNVKRLTNGGTENTDGVYLVTADCHYQADKFFTIQKAPDSSGSFNYYD